MPSNSGWPTGYVPTAAEWANSQSAKVDFPAPVDQGGTGAQSSFSASYNILQRQLVSSSPITPQPLTWYGVRTSVAAITFNLPPLASVQAGDWYQLADIDFAAATHNVTIHASGSEQIEFLGASATTQTITVNGFSAALVRNVSSWSLVALAAADPSVIFTGGFGFESPTPQSDETFIPIVADDDITFPANFGDNLTLLSGIAPSSTCLFSLRLIHTDGTDSGQCGTLSISTSNVMTRTTTGGTALHLTKGQGIKPKAPTIPTGITNLTEIFVGTYDA